MIRAEPATCPNCSCVLASDNPGPLCSPCARARAQRDAAEPFRALRSWRYDHSDLAAAWDDGGLPGLASVLDASLHVALDVAVHLEILPTHLARHVEECHRLIDAAGLGVAAAGEAVGVSRWTVSAWRRELALDNV